MNAHDQERLLPPNPVQPPPAQQMSNTEAGGNQQGNQPGLAQQALPNIQSNLHRQVDHPSPPNQAQQLGRSIVGDDGVEDDLDSNHRDNHPLQQPLQPQLSGKEHSEDKAQMDAEAGRDQARCHEAINTNLVPSTPHRPLPPAKRKVVFSISYLDCTYIAFETPGNHGPRQCTDQA